MKLKVLVDNNTFIDKYYFGEPAVSYYIEDADSKILFDVGYSDLFIQNASALEIDLRNTTDIVISHGHDDHTGGLKHFFEQFSIPDIRITAHPMAFDEKMIGEASISSPLSAVQLAKKAKLTLSDKPVKVSENIYFLGQIPPMNDFEERRPVGEDYLYDDSAIVFKSVKGLYIITGCSHSGICNIIEYSKQVCDDEKIAGVIGGFHLFDVDLRVKKTIEYFLKNNIDELYPCHCVSFQVKAEISKYAPVNEVGVSMELEWI